MINFHRRRQPTVLNTLFSEFPYIISPATSADRSPSYVSMVQVKCNKYLNSPKFVSCSCRSLLGFRDDHYYGRLIAIHTALSSLSSSSSSVRTGAISCVFVCASVIYNVLHAQRNEITAKNRPQFIARDLSSTHRYKRHGGLCR